MFKPLIWVGTFALIMLSLFLVVITNQVLNTSTTTNTISFNGEGKITAKPDVSVVNLSIVTEAPTSKAAQDDNSKKSDAVVNYLKAQGISDKDIKTTSYNIYPQYSSPKPCPLTVGIGYPCTNDTQKISSYQVNETIEVKIRSLDKVSGILDGVVSAGVNQVNNLGFQIDNPEKMKGEARDKAIADAKAKAVDLENKLGIRLGRIVNYSEGGNGWVMPMFMKAESADGRGAPPPSPAVPSGENEISVNVTITYQIR
jgi:uncharacterized protein